MSKKTNQPEETLGSESDTKIKERPDSWLSPSNTNYQDPNDMDITSCLDGLSVNDRVILFKDTNDLRDGAIIVKVTDVLESENYIGSDISSGESIEFNEKNIFDWSKGR